MNIKPIQRIYMVRDLTRAARVENEWDATNFFSKEQICHRTGNPFSYVNHQFHYIGIRNIVRIDGEYKNEVAIGQFQVFSGDDVILTLNIPMLKLGWETDRDGCVMHQQHHLPRTNQTGLFENIQRLVNHSLANYEMGLDYEKVIEIPVDKFCWVDSWKQRAWTQSEPWVYLEPLPLDDGISYFMRTGTNPSPKEIQDRTEFLRWKHKSIDPTRNLINKYERLTDNHDDVVEYCNHIVKKIRWGSYTVRELRGVNKVLRGKIKAFQENGVIA